MKKENKAVKITENYWPICFFVAFGVHLGYIALILLVESFAGTIWAFLPLLLMPLFEAVFGGIYGYATFRRADRKPISFYTALGALGAAGLLYELASLILYGWQWDLGVLLFDAIVILALLLGLLFGIRFETLRRKLHQRRTRFDD